MQPSQAGTPLCTIATYHQDGANVFYVIYSLGLAQWTYVSPGGGIWIVPSSPEGIQKSDTSTTGSYAGTYAPKSSVPAACKHQ